MLPWHQVGQKRPREIIARARGPERRLPVVGAVPPGDGAEDVDRIERRQLLFPRPLDPGVTHPGRRVPVRRAAPHRHGDGHRRPDGKHIGALPCAALLASQIENPDLVAQPAHMLPHPHEGRPVQIARRRDEAHDAGAARRLVLEHLPQRPTPEIHIQVVEVLCAHPVPGQDRRCHEVAQDGIRTLAVIAPSHPRPRAIPVVRPRRLVAVVGRVAEADQHGNRALHRQRLLALLGDGPEEKPQLRRLGMRAFQGIRQVDMRAVGRQRRAPVSQRTADAQLAHRIGAGQKLEAVKVPRQRRCLPRHRARALFGLDAAQGVRNDAQQVGPGAHGRVEGDDARIGEAQWPAQTPRQECVHQTDLGADHRERRVVDARILAQPGIVGGEEILVEMKPRVARPGERRRRDHGGHAQQEAEGRRQVGAHLPVGQDLQGAGEQIVPRRQRRLGAVKRERVRPLAAAQKQGERHRLSVGVGELRVRGVREQQLPPIRGQGDERGGGIADGGAHVVA